VYDHYDVAYVHVQRTFEPSERAMLALVKEGERQRFDVRPVFLTIGLPTRGNFYGH